MIPITPRGFKDVLPDEARWREEIITCVQARLALWGYDPIETPTLEVGEVLELGGTLSDQALRLIDSDGKLLVLRPDVTLPVARLVASRRGFAERLGERPLRFRYTQSVFREQESLRAQAREFTQIGTELIGKTGAAADAEVVLLFSEALAATGLSDYTIVLCTVGVLRELITACIRVGDLPSEWGASVLAASHRSDLVALQTLVDDPRLPKHYQAALLRIFGIRGGREAIEECRELVDGLDCMDGLEQLATSYAIIEQSEAHAHVLLDFSVMSDFDYYTGMVFEAYAPGLGLRLGGGGRYDRMLADFGLDAPAAGFAFGLERAMHALLTQEGADRANLGGADLRRLSIDDDDPAKAFREAQILRAQGLRIALDFAPSTETEDREDA
ncbi:MAG: ATP phosphoribosyltransferase regulatory subunit [Coriobacteriales bacterium]|jgi:ATP phosphoribosyltransferase regulatory subunit|nr:ATP phosphoribosyltransferase regulatory subunit [Coriobacteriales bacterium]